MIAIIQITLAILIHLRRWMTRRRRVIRRGRKLARRRILASGRILASWRIVARRRGRILASLPFAAVHPVLQGVRKTGAGEPNLRMTKITQCPEDSYYSLSGI